MKLLRLKITDPAGFRSLQPGFEVYFLREQNYSEAHDFNPYILAGPNGSGKSNVLEALAAIFFHIECVYLNYRPESFEFNEINNPMGFRGEVSAPDGFEVEYFIPAPNSFNQTACTELAQIKISKEVGRAPVVSWENSSLFDAMKDNVLDRTEAREVLPEFILGYSSGENEILSLPFLKMRFIHLDEYRDFIVNRAAYGGAPEGRLTFLSSEFNQAILLSNLLLQKELLVSTLKDDVGLEDIKEFRIIIKKYLKIDQTQVTDDPGDTVNFQKDIIEVSDDDFGQKVYRLKITQNLEPLIQKLMNCSTCSYYDDKADELYLDYWVNEETKQAFAHHFDSAIELFQAFQILLTLNLYKVSERLKKGLYQSCSLYVNETVPTLPSDERVMRFKNFWIKKTGVEENLLIKSLSDGEHQLLHSLGLCLLYKDKQCLFLLDEPETHFNPDWRAKFISRIRGCFGDKDAKSAIREMLITTHTPFLISDSRNDYVLVFNKDKSNLVTVAKPEYNTLGASINKITMKTFGKTETISDYALAILKGLKERFDRGESSQVLIDEADMILGDSVEKVLFINKLMGSEE